MRHYLFILFLCITLNACAPQAAAPLAAVPTPAQTPGVAATAVLPSGVLFQVIKLDGTPFNFSLDDLKKYPLGQIMDDGKVEEGPKLVDILTAAGVTEYQSIHLAGSSSPADLTREQVEKDAILDFTNRGTVKLSTSALPKTAWTHDIHRIEVH